MNLSTAPNYSGSGFMSKKQKATFDKREGNAYNREYEPSPVFSFSGSALATQEEEVFDFFEDAPRSRKYGSMSNLVVQNSSSQAIRVYLNQDRNRSFTIPGGVIRSWDSDEIQGGVNSITIKNIGSGSISASEVFVETFKVGTQISTSFQNIHKKIFKLAGY